MRRARASCARARACARYSATYISAVSLCARRGERGTHAWRFEEVEAPVPEVVVAPQARDDGRVGGEGELDDFAPEEVGLWDHRVWVERVAGAEGGLAEPSGASVL